MYGKWRVYLSMKNLPYVTLIQVGNFMHNKIVFIKSVKLYLKIEV